MVKSAGASTYSHSATIASSGTRGSCTDFSHRLSGLIATKLTNTPVCRTSRFSKSSFTGRDWLRFLAKKRSFGALVKGAVDYRNLGFNTGGVSGGVGVDLNSVNRTIGDAMKDPSSLPRRYSILDRWKAGRSIAAENEAKRRRIADGEQGAPDYESYEYDTSKHNQYYNRPQSGPIPNSSDMPDVGDMTYEEKMWNDRLQRNRLRNAGVFDKARYALSTGVDAAMLVPRGISGVLGAAGVGRGLAAIGGLGLNTVLDPLQYVRPEGSPNFWGTLGGVYRDVVNRYYKNKYGQDPFVNPPDWYLEQRLPGVRYGTRDGVRPARPSDIRR